MILLWCAIYLLVGCGLIRAVYSVGGPFEDGAGRQAGFFVLVWPSVLAILFILGLAWCVSMFGVFISGRA